MYVCVCVSVDECIIHISTNPQSHSLTHSLTPLSLVCSGGIATKPVAWSAGQEGVCHIAQGCTTQTPRGQGNPGNRTGISSSDQRNGGGRTIAIVRRTCSVNRNVFVCWFVCFFSSSLTHSRTLSHLPACVCYISPLFSVSLLCSCSLLLIVLLSCC
jgi:hypothetical protein